MLVYQTTTPRGGSMGDDDRLRIGRWVDHREASYQVSGGGQVPVDVTVEGAGAYAQRGYGEDDHPTTGVPTVGRVNGDDDDGYRGHRRAGEDDKLPLRRAITVAIMVGALLIGVGVMARSLSGGPEFMPAPPPTPDGQDGPAGGTARLVAAPTTSPEAPGTTPAPAPTPPDNGDPGEDTPEPTPPTPTTPPTTAPIASYESEDGDYPVGPHTSVVSRDDASGGKVVEFTTGSANAHVTHPDVSVGSPGIYRLTIIYFTNTAKQVRVIVNGADTVVTLAPPDDPDAPGAFTLSVELTSGANVVEIINGDSPGLQLDRITIAE